MLPEVTPSCPIILLAAGGSLRLGQPKQLLPFGQGTLLRHAAETAIGAELGPVIVVLGAVAPQCRFALDGLPLTVVENTDWREGMGSSIAMGMQEVNELGHCAVILMLCDQPALTSTLLRSLAEQERSTGKPIVASRYGGTLGPPALFTSEWFPQLRLLNGNQGAKSLFQNQDEVAVVDWPEGALDIDTVQDLALLRV